MKTQIVKETKGHVESWIATVNARGMQQVIDEWYAVLCNSNSVPMMVMIHEQRVIKDESDR
jgi:hypothetical protein